MTYGIKLVNDNDEAILDEVGFAYYLKKAGRTIRSQTDGTSSDPYNIYGSQSYAANSGTRGGWIGGSNLYYKAFWAAESLDFPGGKFSRLGNQDVPAAFIPSPKYNINDLAFWQIGTIGICWAENPYLSEVQTGFFLYGGNSGYPIGGYAFCLSDRDNSNGLNYMILSPDEPGVPSGNFGMRVFNPSNEKIYDNRFPSASIEEVLIIPSATVMNVLENNAIVDISLSKAVPDCYISSPNLNSFYRVSEFINVRTDVYVLNVAQLNSTTLRLSRKTLIASGNNADDSTWGNLRISATQSGRPGPGFRAYAFDTVLFVSAGPHV